jgi:glucose-6-phosphate isomerase
MIHFSTNVPLASPSLKKTEEAWVRLHARADLGFWQLPARDENWSQSQAMASRLAKSSKRLAVLGLGGSAMGGRCLVTALGDPSKVSFLFNTDPKTVEGFFADQDLIRDGHFLFISKSGNTLELACLLEILVQRLQQAGRELRDALSVITEERSNPLFNWAKSQGVPVVAHPQDVGGRFSGFSPVGLVPAFYAGVSGAELRQGAQSGQRNRDLITRLAAFYLESFSRGETISVFWSYSDQLQYFLPWLVQLWAESLAKDENREGARGPTVSTPVGYLGTCDQHSVLQQLMDGAKDKSICFIRDRSLELQGQVFNGKGLPGFEYLKGLNLGRVFSTQSLSTEEALGQAGRSTLQLELDQVDALHVGELMMVYEMVIGVLGEALNIDAFNQPGVELGKKITKEKLQKNSQL